MNRKSTLRRRIEEEIEQTIESENKRVRSIEVFDHRYSDIARQTGTEPFEEMTKYGAAVE